MPSVNDPNVSGSTQDIEHKDSGVLTEARIHEIVNSALAGRDKRYDKRLAEMLETSLSPFKEQFLEKSQEKSTIASNSVPSNSQSNSEVIALQKQLELMQKTLKQKEDATALQAKSIREKEAFGQLKTILNGKVRPDAVDHVAKLIFHADKKIKVGEDGSMAYQVDADNEIDVQEGVKQYLKSKDALIFLPAPVTSKTGGLRTVSNPLPTRTSQEGNNNSLVKGNFSDAASMLSKLGLKL